jgi:hypothetical protein
VRRDLEFRDGRSKDGIGGQCRHLLAPAQARLLAPQRLCVLTLRPHKSAIRGAQVDGGMRRQCRVVAQYA